MKTTFFSRIGSLAFRCAAFGICLLCLASVSDGQRRDYLIDEEIEIVRENQDIDVRVEVLVKMIDRRFSAIGIDIGGWKMKDKESPVWGTLPELSRADTLWDIRQIMNKAMEDIDTIAERDGDALMQNRTSGKLFPKAVKSLEKAAKRYLPKLKELSAAITNDRERGPVETLIGMCEDVIQAAATIPEPKK